MQLHLTISFGGCQLRPLFFIIALNNYYYQVLALLAASNCISHAR
ncbi:hypothetical protein Nizo1840_2312 [Lactiplantibacillus plantarum]|nr:hypothetical protein Nizo1840_2312 [Lactiplantibacillus plantarum]